MRDLGDRRYLAGTPVEVHMKPGFLFVIAGMPVAAIGLLSSVIAIAKIADDMTPKGFLGFRYLYGTGGHPELMTAHEWGMIFWVVASVSIALFGVAFAVLGGISSFSKGGGPKS